MGYASMNIKDITIFFDNSLLFTESIQNTTQIFPRWGIYNVRFLPCQHRGVGIMQYVYALNPVCIVSTIPGHSRREVPRQGCGHS